MTSLDMLSVDWKAGLKRSGLYLEGVVEASSLNTVLKAHKRALYPPLALGPALEIVSVKPWVKIHKILKRLLQTMNNCI